VPKLTDAELVAAIEQEERQSIDTHSGELHKERVDALARYRGELLGNEIDGRSQIVDMTILDTIESIMPSLIAVFTGGENMGEFEPRGPEDEAAAKAETEAVNWNLGTKNDLFSHVNATLRDALLLKNGYMVGYWQTRVDEMTETYVGLADEEVAMLAQDPEVKITEHSEYPDPLWQPPMNAMAGGPQASLPGGAVMGAPPGGPAGPGGQAGERPAPPMLHDVTVERKKGEEYVAVESVPPDEILVSRRHRWTSLLDADFVQWRRRVTIGQLRAEGFDVPDDVPSEGEFSQEWAERQRFNEQMVDDDETVDPSRRQVIFKDTYIRINLDDSPEDKGIPKLWRVCVINGYKQTILKEAADIIPFAAFSPIIYPHSHIGSSVYDQIKDIGIIKTTLQRQFLDGVYLQNNGEKIVNVDNCPNLDDFLVSRPGGIKRVNGVPSDAYMPVSTPDNGPSILAALQYMDDVNTRRTGVQTNQPGALDPNAMNNTQIEIRTQSQAAERIGLIARTLVSGFRDIFLITHALLSKHSTKPLQMKLDNTWTTINPREWTRRTDFKINVGLGTGSPQMKMGPLQAMIPVMQQELAMGLAGPDEIYNMGCELWKAAGYPVHKRFIHPPAQDPQTGKAVMPPPPPNPLVQVEQIKADSAMKIAQGKGQLDAQSSMQKLQTEDQIAQRKHAADQAVQASNDERDAAKLQMEYQLKRSQMLLEMKQRDLEHTRDQQTQIQIANIKAAAQVEVAEIAAKAANDAAQLEAKEQAAAGYSGVQ
jgi:hypothetical protein